MAKTKKWKTRPKIECKRLVKGRQKLCNHVISRKNSHLRACFLKRKLRFIQTSFKNLTCLHPFDYCFNRALFKFHAF